LKCSFSRSGNGGPRTLAGGIAHDFNNMLEGIIGFAEMIREDSVAGNQQHKRIGLVLKGANRGRDLVKQILTFSRQTGQDQKIGGLKARSWKRDSTAETRTPFHH